MQGALDHRENLLIIRWYSSSCERRGVIIRPLLIQQIIVVFVNASRYKGVYNDVSMLLLK